MERYGSELLFISVIAADGFSLDTCISKKTIELLSEEKFTLNSLSISKRTYIASGINSYVVKLKNPPIK